MTLGDNLPTCLPVPPSIREIRVTEVTYCIERRSDHIWHVHVALYDTDSGSLLADTCTLNALVTEGAA